MHKKSNQWLYDLPKNSTESAAFAIKRLCVQIHPMDSEKAITDYLSNIIRINKRAIKGWLEGQIYHKRGRITFDHFRTLVTHFAQTPGGLVSWEEVVCFAELFSPEYVMELGKDWGLNLQSGYAPESLLPPESDIRYPKQINLIPRSYLVEMIDRICAFQKSPIIIWGHPGMGKTTLMHQLQHHPKIVELFGENILTAFLGGQQPQAFYRPWINQVWPKLQAVIQWPQDDGTLRQRIQRRIQGQQYLLLLDDVALPDYAERLMLADFSANSVVVITTNSYDTARTLERQYQGTLLPIPCFSIEETCQFYESINGREIEEGDKVYVSELHGILQGNPLGLHTAFYQSRKMPLHELLGLIKILDPITPAELEPAIYLPVRVAYERMNDSTQKRFAALAKLPFLYSYDLKFLAMAFDPENEPEKRIASRIIEQINTALGTFVPLNEAKDEWQIHSQILLFAKCIGGSLGPGDDESLLERAVNHNVDKDLFPPRQEVNYFKWLFKIFDLKRPEQFEPQMNLGRRLVSIFKSRKYLTQWEIIKRNLAVLRSQEYVRAYRLYRQEQKQRSSIYIFSGGTLIICAIVVALSVWYKLIGPISDSIVNLALNFFNIWLILMLAFIVVFTVINSINVFNWNRLFELIGKRK